MHAAPRRAKGVPSCCRRASASASTWSGPMDALPCNNPPCVGPRRGHARPPARERRPGCWRSGEGQEPKGFSSGTNQASEKARFIVLQPIPGLQAAKACEAQSNSTVRFWAVGTTLICNRKRTSSAWPIPLSRRSSSLDHGTVGSGQWAVGGGRSRQLNGGRRYHTPRGWRAVWSSNINATRADGEIALRVRSAVRTQLQSRHVRQTCDIADKSSVTALGVGREREPYQNVRGG
jgi:hypothetical protein